jgi:hypothetical protein
MNELILYPPLNWRGVTGSFRISDRRRPAAELEGSHEQPQELFVDASLTELSHRRARTSGNITCYFWEVVLWRVPRHLVK